MIAEFAASEYAVSLNDSKQIIQSNPFENHECVLKKCCKKYKKGKRCKKCPD